MTTKQFYETPTTKTLVVRFEGVLCGSFDRENGTEKFIVGEDEDL